MGKRPHEQENHSSHKKHRSNDYPRDDRRTGIDGPTYPQNQQRHGKDGKLQHGDGYHDRDKSVRPQEQHNSNGLAPASSDKADVPAFVPFKPSTTFPDLPVLSKRLATVPFQHSSSVGYDRTITTSDLSYERLEFLGDAYLEVIASRLVFNHFAYLPAGGQSQVRELLVKNETLAEYAKLYGFEKKLQIVDIHRLSGDSRNRGNKGLNKILGDSFEAYIAAIILGDPEHGFAIAEKWLTALWAPKLAQAARSHIGQPSSLKTSDDPLSNYDPTAKAELQRKIYSREVKLDYEAWRATEELKGDQLGQNKHFIALYLTGYGYTRKLLAKGEGKNKVEAGNWAAAKAMHGEFKELVADCTAKLAAIREARKEQEEQK